MNNDSDIKQLKYRSLNDLIGCYALRFEEMYNDYIGQFKIKVERPYYHTYRNTPLCIKHVYRTT